MPPSLHCLGSSIRALFQLYSFSMHMSCRCYNYMSMLNIQWAVIASPDLSPLLMLWCSPPCVSNGRAKQHCCTALHDRALKPQMLFMVSNIFTLNKMIYGGMSSIHKEDNNWFLYGVELDNYIVYVGKTLQSSKLRQSIIYWQHHQHVYDTYFFRLNI